MSPFVPIYVAVVDDDESQCRSFGRLLRACGMQAVTYASAEDFLADTKHPQFDCLILDIQFEGMSGLELQKQLTETGSRTPVIFVTAYDEPEFRDEALAGGCAGFFRKTEVGATVVGAIRNAITNAFFRQRSSTRPL